jgi:hypothetical protein
MLKANRTRSAGLRARVGEYLELRRRLPPAATVPLAGCCHTQHTAHTAAMQHASCCNVAMTLLLGGGCDTHPTQRRSRSCLAYMARAQPGQARPETCLLHRSARRRSGHLQCAPIMAEETTRRSFNGSAVAASAALGIYHHGRSVCTSHQGKRHVPRTRKPMQHQLHPHGAGPLFGTLF